MTNEAVYWNVFRAVYRIVDRVVDQAEYRMRKTGNRTLAAVVSGTVQSDVHWSVQAGGWAAKDAAARLEEPPHPGLMLYLGGVA